MAFAAYQDNGVALAGYAYLCWQGGCRRWYDPGTGYFDVVNGRRVNVPAGATCPSHGLPMYDFHFDFIAQSVQLRCPLTYCPHESVQMGASNITLRKRFSLAHKSAVRRPVPFAAAFPTAKRGWS